MSMPTYLVSKYRYGKNEGTIDKLGPLQEELFNVFQWAQDSNIGWMATDPFGHMVKLDNRAGFPDCECQVILEAFGDNCRPTYETLKVRWTGQNVEVERIPATRLPADLFESTE
jgi:hypothetical protein